MEDFISYPVAAQRRRTIYAVDLSAVGAVFPIWEHLLRSDSYANANCWDDLVYAFTGSLRDSFLDEIVLLLHADIPGPDGWRSEYVRPVSYDSLDEVPELLLSTTPSALRAGATITCQRRPRIEVETGWQPYGNHDGQWEQVLADIPSEMISDGEEAEVATPGLDYEEEIDEAATNAAKVIQDAYRHYLERRRAGAARKIQIAYRRHLEWKRAVAGSTLATHHLKRKSVVRVGVGAIHVRYWRLLRKRSVEMLWSKNSRYYLLFRVPLGYILVCLDVIKTFAESEKKEAKKQVMTADNRDLENLMEALDRYRYDGVDCVLDKGSDRFSSKLLKKTIPLQEKLSPSSKFHEERSVVDLQHAVLEVKSVVESLDDIPGSIGIRNKIRGDWNRGWKWIFEK